MVKRKNRIERGERPRSEGGAVAARTSKVISALVRGRVNLALRTKGRR